MREVEKTSFWAPDGDSLKVCNGTHPLALGPQGGEEGAGPEMRASQIDAPTSGLR